MAKESIDFTANLKINGIDSVGLVNKVTQIISKQLNVISNQSILILMMVFLKEKLH